MFGNEDVVDVVVLPQVSMRNICFTIRTFDEVVCLGITEIGVFTAVVLNFTALVTISAIGDDSMDVAIPDDSNDQNVVLEDLRFDTTPHVAG